MAKLCRSVCTDTGLCNWVAIAASRTARCNTESPIWCRRTTPARGSTDNDGLGNTQY